MMSENQTNIGIVVLNKMASRFFSSKKIRKDNQRQKIIVARTLSKDANQLLGYVCVPLSAPSRTKT